MQILHSLAAYRNNIAVITDTGEKITYGDIAEFAGTFKTHTDHRCLVFCLCQNTPGSFLGYISFLSNQVVPLLLEATLDKQLLEELISTYKPEYIYLPIHRVSDFPGYKMVYTVEGYSLLKCDFEDHYGLHDDLALLFTTSGSTGSPKLVRISYENLDANAISIAEYLSIDQKERPITSLPMSYSYGLSIINSHLLKGATILLTDRSLMESRFWSFFKEEQATSMGGVPYTYEILKKLRFFNMELPSLQTLTQAGGKLNSELSKEFAEFCYKSGKRMFVMYGQTEATARMAYLPPEFARFKIGSMGKAIPGGEFWLIDDQRKPIEGCEVVGELVYRGKNVSHGYAECGTDLMKGDENGGVLYTEDLAKRDSDGLYYIVGRKKRFIKLFGNRVNLDETERILKNVISDCACVGEDDKMVIYITEPERQEEIKIYISGKTGININAFSVKIIQKIPKNTSGKTIYSNLDIR